MECKQIIVEILAYIRFSNLERKNMHKRDNILTTISQSFKIESFYTKFSLKIYVWDQSGNPTLERITK